MKAMKAKEVPLDKLDYPLWAQLKYDGVRIITTIKEGKIRLRTYNGNDVNLPYMRDIFRASHYNNIMLDGEMVIYNGTMSNRTTVSGMINSAMHGGTINERILNYAIFDTMSIQEFESCNCNILYKDRYWKALDIITTIGMPLTIARNIVVQSSKEVIELSEQMYRDGYEGLILKSVNHLYSFKRDKAWAKIKQTKTADLKCIDVTEGTGKYEGMIGALICEGIVEGKNVLVKAGSGLSDNQRARSFDYYINKIIEIKYNSIIKDTVTGKWSLFLPRFVHVRFDK